MTKPVRETGLIDRALSGYRATMFYAGVMAMSLMMAVILTQIVCRYLLGFSLIWSEEFCRVLLIWITFLFGGLALERGEVIAVDFLSTSTRGFTRIAILLLGGLVSLVVLCWMAWLGYQYAIFNLGQKLAAMQISQFWVYISLPVGLLLLSAHFAVHLGQQIAIAYAEIRALGDSL